MYTAGTHSQLLISYLFSNECQEALGLCWWQNWLTGGFWPASTRFCIPINLYVNARPIWHKQKPVDKGPKTNWLKMSHSYSKGVSWAPESVAVLLKKLTIILLLSTNHIKLQCQQFKPNRHYVGLPMYAASECQPLHSKTLWRT